MRGHTAAAMGSRAFATLAENAGIETTALQSLKRIGATTLGGGRTKTPKTHTTTYQWGKAPRHGHHTNRVTGPSTAAGGRRTRTARTTTRRVGAMELQLHRLLWGMETVPRNRVLVISRLREPTLDIRRRRIEKTQPPDANTLAGATCGSQPRKVRAGNGTHQGHRHEGGGNGA